MHIYTINWTQCCGGMFLCGCNVTVGGGREGSSIGGCGGAVIDGDRNMQTNSKREILEKASNNEI